VKTDAANEVLRFSSAFLLSLYFILISFVLFTAYSFQGLEIRGTLSFGGRAKALQVTYVTQSSWCFPLPLRSAEVPESKGNENVRDL